MEKTINLNQSSRDPISIWRKMFLRKEASLTRSSNVQIQVRYEETAILICLISSIVASIEYGTLGAGESNLLDSVGISSSDL